MLQWFLVLQELRWLVGHDQSIIGHQSSFPGGGRLLTMHWHAIPFSWEHSCSTSTSLLWGWEGSCDYVLANRKWYTPLWGWAWRERLDLLSELSTASWDLNHADDKFPKDGRATRWKEPGSLNHHIELKYLPAFNINLRYEWETQIYFFSLKPLNLGVYLCNGSIPCPN